MRDPGNEVGLSVDLNTKTHVQYSQHMSQTPHSLTFNSLWERSTIKRKGKERKFVQSSSAGALSGDTVN